jgi:hypothetical protein
VATERHGRAEEEVVEGGSTAGGTAPEPADGRSPADRVFGIVSVVALVLAGVFGAQMLLGGAGDTGAAPTAAAVPSLAIVEPVDGARVASPVAVVVSTSAKLEPGPMGWTAGGRHLHLTAGGAELMAGAADIAPAGPGRWRWTVPLPPGEQTLRVYWSGADHVRMESGASRPVRVRVR